MRWMQLEAPEGALYVDLSQISAIGPAIRDKDLTGQLVTMRAVYLVGGQCLAIFDTADNMSKLFESSGRVS